MASPINKNTLEHLAKLARIELEEKEKEALLKDLQKILDHFEELKELNTTRVEPMAGGMRHKNALREDADAENTDRTAGIDQFPESSKGFLKVPPVFNE